MINIVVNDASCLIDLRKGGLLEVVCDLPYRFVVPLPIRESEILDFSESQWQHLDDAGLITYDLTSIEVREAIALKKHYPALSANDCFCMVTALSHNGILLTGDKLLRRVSAEKGLSVHGVLWVVDQLDSNETCPKSRLIHALEVWQDNDAVFLPEHEIFSRLEQLKIVLAPV